MKNLFSILAVIGLGYVLLGLPSCGFIKKEIEKVEAPKLLRPTKPFLDSLGRSLGQQLAGGLADSARFVSKNLLEGLKGFSDSMDPDIQKVYRTIEQIGSMSDAELKKLATTLRSELAAIKGDVNDKEFANALVGMLEKLTGKLRADTKYLLADMVENGIAVLGTDSTRAKLDKAIAHLLSDTLTARTQNLVTLALKPTIDSLEKKIDRVVNGVHKEVGLLQKYAKEWLLLLGAVALGIIAFVWHQRRKYLKLTQLLTLQIHKIQSKSAYDELTQRIHDEALSGGLEKPLREVLKEQGINQ